MAAIVWVVEGTWPACVDAARRFVPEESEIVLLHVTSEDISSVAHAAHAGMFGRAEPEHDPSFELDHLAADSAAALLRSAASRLARPCGTVERVGHVEHEVVAATQGAEMLVMARDGEPAVSGPKSLGHAGRWVLEHAPCPVLLVWA
jgi:nucleotide-binding universal stress UspA family protein